MKLQDYIDYIKLELTGGVLELEIDDNTLAKFVKRALVEIQRYIDVTKMVTVPFAPCIDLNGFNSSAIVAVYRTEGYTGDSTKETSSNVDPMYAQTWMAFSPSGPSMYNLNSYLLNYMSYNTLLQMRNTTSTDLSFKEDKDAKKLYINAIDKPASITIEYVPVYLDCEDITSDYWIDILERLSLALVKVTLGRIRTRFKVSNNPYSDDGDTILQEGQTELENLREVLRTNSNLFLPTD